MICPHCQHEVPDGNRFCDSCGALLPKVEEASTSTQASTPEEAQLDQDTGDSRELAHEGGNADLPGVSHGSEAPREVFLQPSTPIAHTMDEVYHQEYEPFDIHGPDSTDIMRPVASIPEHMVDEHRLDAIPLNGNSEAMPHLDEPRRQYEEPNTDSQIPTIIGLALGAVGLVAIIFGFKACASRFSNESHAGSAGSAMVVATPKNQGSAGSESVSAEQEKEVKAEQESSLPQPEVRDTVADYSWEELSQISALISERADADKAREVAVRYHLLNEDGTLTEVTHEIAMTDGVNVQARIAGIYHDDLADGSGKAGISFYVPFIAGLRGMNSSSTNAEGWAGSEMRAWLNSPDGIEGRLPQDLRDNIAPASKLTNNTGRSVQTDSVTTSADRVWLFSLKEVCGDISWEWPTEPGNSENFNQIANLEGSQYQLFRELGVVAGETNSGVINRDAYGSSTHWWLRSPALGTDSQFRYIAYDGNTSESGEASYEIGVVFGFCV